MEDHLRALGTGTLHLFSAWQQAGVPHVAAGVYTIWQRTDGPLPPRGLAPGQLVYVGLAGGLLSAEQIQTKRRAAERRTALWSRLHTHAGGSRSGDQLAVYIADRFILGTLRAEEIEAVAAGRLSLDKRVRDHVAAHLAFRWVETADGPTARVLETMIRGGQWDHGKPFLNPR